MVISAKYVTVVALALAVISSPSFAGPHMSKARVAALRECNAKAAKFSFHTWQTEQFAVYRACMFAHGQME
jgi:hypothetical protein